MYIPLILIYFLKEIKKNKTSQPEESFNVKIVFRKNAVQ